MNSVDGTGTLPEQVTDYIFSSLHTFHPVQRPELDSRPRPNTAYTHTETEVTSRVYTRIRNFKSGGIKCRKWVRALFKFHRNCSVVERHRRSRDAANNNGVFQNAKTDDPTERIVRHMFRERLSVAHRTS